MSFPNYYSLGPNIDFFQAHGVRGVFEEGPGMGPGDGTDLEELKDYVMAEKLWDPSLDHEVLISEFLSGYYGSAAPFIRLYMDTMVSSCFATLDTLHAFRFASVTLKIVSSSRSPWQCNFVWFVARCSG